MPVFACQDCAELHAQRRKWPAYTGYGTCGCSCPLCGNEGRTLCGACGGKGTAGLFGRPCKQCNGERTLVCAICRGYLAHPSCPVCRGTSCETCYGSRTVDLESILSTLQPVPRRRTVFRPTESPRNGSRMDFPVFTYQRAWQRLSPVVDLSIPISLRRDSGWQRVHLSGKLIAQDRADYWIYRIAADEYGIEERVPKEENWAD